MGKSSEQIEAWLDDIEGIKPAKPKVVTKDSEVVRDAVAHVSKADPNYRGSDGGFVKVQRSDFVTVRMDVYEEQMRERAEARRQRRLLDPYRLGHWGPVDDE